MEKEAIDVIDFYNKPGMAEYYYNQVSLEGNLPTEILKGVVCNDLPKNLKPNGGLMIDLGCGPGNGIIDLVSVFNFKEIVAVDASTEMISLIEKKVDTKKVKLRTQLADLRHDNLDVASNSANMVISLCVMPYLDNIEKIFSEVGRTLKKDGLFIFNMKIHEETKVETLPVFGGPIIPVWFFIYHDYQIISLARKYNMSGITCIILNDEPRTWEVKSTKHLLYILVKK